jgi:hypothetical protein
MSLEKITSISGFSGLFKVITTRKDGIVAEDLVTGKSTFASSRKHQFTPLASIGIYTDDGDSIALFQLYKNMLEHRAEMPATEQSAQDNAAFFAKVLPTYDRDRVYPQDIKKAIKWFRFLADRELINENNLNEFLKSIEEKEETEEKEA